MTPGIIAVIGPVTTAARLAKKIEQTSGVSARMIHTPEAVSGGGCSYSVKTKSEYLPVIMQTAEKYKIKVKAYYIIEIAEGKEVYHDIS